MDCHKGINLAFLHARLSTLPVSQSDQAWTGVLTGSIELPLPNGSGFLFLNKPMPHGIFLSGNKLDFIVLRVFHTYTVLVTDSADMIRFICLMLEVLSVTRSLWLLVSIFMCLSVRCKTVTWGNVIGGIMNAESPASCNADAFVSNGSICDEQMIDYTNIFTEVASSLRFPLHDVPLAIFIHIREWPESG